MFERQILTGFAVMSCGINFLNKHDKLEYDT